jgi:hypothetical protein
MERQLAHVRDEKRIGKSEGSSNFGDLDAYRRMTLKWVLRNRLVE